MRTSLPTAAFGCLLLSLAACDTQPESQASLLQPPLPNYSVTCTNPNDLVYATASGNKYPITQQSIAEGCGSEVCMGHGGVPQASAVSLTADANGTYDRAYIVCPDSTVQTVYSNHTCWYCWGCAAPWSCGGEDACNLTPGTSGWDCLGYNCPSGYEPYQWAEPNTPVCIRSWTANDCCDDSDCATNYYCSSGTCKLELGASLDGPSTIPVDDWCTWTASVTGGTSPYTYTWYYDGQYRSSGSDSYSGGVLSGDLDNAFALTLWVHDQDNNAASAQVYVQEDSNAMPCPH